MRSEFLNMKGQHLVNLDDISEDQLMKLPAYVELSMKWESLERDYARLQESHDERNNDDGYTKKVSIRVSSLLLNSEI
jgi:hypothetical protein